MVEILPEKNSQKEAKVDPVKKNGGCRRNPHFKKLGQAGKPLVSIITVVFNGEKTLEETIRSIVLQDYDYIEYIIIDGGSTDGTLDIIRRHDSQIDYWVSEHDTGIYDAMNKGIALASGEYIGMLNADDFFSGTQSVRMIVERLVANKLDAVFSQLDIVDADRPEKILRKYRVARFDTWMLRIGVMPPHPTFYCRRSCYEKLGAAPYRTDYKIAADFELMVRLLLTQNISWGYLAETTVKMKSGGVSNNSLGARWLLNREIIRACKQNGLYTNMLFLILKIPMRLLECIR